LRQLTPVGGEEPGWRDMDQTELAHRNFLAHRGTRQDRNSPANMTRCLMNSVPSDSMMVGKSTPFGEQLLEPSERDDLEIAG
jgi:hypothetical protein